MTRALLSIGCDKYQHIQQLNSAEHDARQIFDALCIAGRYGYSKELSLLRLSPTLSDLNSSLLSLYDTKPQDLTVYFAGHSESKDGRLYLKVADTQDAALPVTSLTLADLIEKLAQIASVQRLNVILDSCNSGGIATDLADILSDRLKSNLSNVSISILAAAGPRMAAKSTVKGGYLTTEILRTINGDLAVQRWSPFLELAQVAETVKHVQSVRRQEPSYWGMNVRGPNPLASNPQYDAALGATAMPETFFGTDVKLSAEQVNAIRKFISQVSDKGYSPDLLRPVQTCLQPLPTAQQVSVFLGLSETLRNPDGYLGPSSGLMLLVQALLPLCSDISVQSILAYHAGRLVPDLLTKVVDLGKQVAEEPRALAREYGGAMAGFYFFPIQLSKILGWIGFCILHSSKHSDSDISVIKSLVDTIIDNYGNNLVCIEEQQAFGILMFYLAARKIGWREQADAVSSLYFNDVWTSGGRIARDDLSSRDQLKYTLEKANPLADLEGILQKPSDLIGVVLFAGATSGLDDEWDTLLVEIDRLSINYFFCEDYSKFSQDRIETGHNVTLRVGDDFWSLFDLRQFFYGQMDDWTGANDKLSLAVNAMSLYLGERVNWSYVFGLVFDGALTIEPAWRRLSTEDARSEQRVVLFEKGTRQTSQRRSPNS